MNESFDFTAAEFSQILEFVAARRHIQRNRMVLLMMRFWTGMRVGEIASLMVDDEVDARGTVQQETRLAAAQTKDNYDRTVFLPEKLVSMARVAIAVDAASSPTSSAKVLVFEDWHHWQDIAAFLSL